MELKSINSIPNKYPETRGVSESYTTTSGAVIYSGKFKENTIEFSNQYWNLQAGYNVVPGTSFQFIVRFNDGSFYTSPSFNNKIEKIKKEVNPYVTEASLPIVLFDDSALQSYPTKREFDIGEKYAEVEISNTLNTKLDYLMHIDYLTTPDSGRSPLKQASEIGSWDLQTSSELGMTYQPDIDDIESQEENFGENQPSSEVFNPQPQDTESTTAYQNTPRSKERAILNSDGSRTVMTKTKDGDGKTTITTKRFTDDMIDN